MKVFSKRLVVILNKKLEPGQAMNAIAHAMLGFGSGAIDSSEVSLNHYIDADGNKHSNISEMPIVILKAKPNKLRELRKLAIQHDVKFVDFTHSMSIGTYEEEFELTKSLTDEELEYWAIILFGPSDLITEWTEKFSLYR